MIPRFRFAPSPTGEPHVGNLHTALFSWLLARSMKGDFVIRIDDTDVERNAPEATQSILEALSWLGVDWDEGPDIGGDCAPYVQSERLSAHQRVIKELVDGDHAYYGDDPHAIATQPSRPDGNPLRLRMPETGRTTLDDLIRGPIHFDNEKLMDPIIVRSDGRPLYHLATVIDDHDMNITHVVRAEDWISSSPIHIQLYRALGWQEPIWIHLPLILNKQGQKLKKRDPEGGYQISDFQAAGYLAEAVFNYLLLLGWAPDVGQEIMSRRQARQRFRVERLSPSPAIFDWDKLNWVNRQHIRKLSDEALSERVRPYLEEHYDTIPVADAWLVRAMAVVRDQLTNLAEATELLQWAFDDEPEYTGSGRRALAGDSAKLVLTQLVVDIAPLVLLDQRTAASIVHNLRSAFQQSHGWTARQILQPVRAALTGHTNGPPVHQIMGIIGKERTLRRLGAVLRE